MTIKTVQFALAQNTATNLVPASSFPNQPGSLQDPLSCSVKNEDGVATIWIGGPDVTNTKGQSLAPLTSQPFALYKNDIPWAYTTSAGTPVVSVMVAGQ